MEAIALRLETLTADHTPVHPQLCGPARAAVARTVEACLRIDLKAFGVRPLHAGHCRISWRVMDGPAFFAHGGEGTHRSELAQHFATDHHPAGRNVYSHVAQAHGTLPESSTLFDDASAIGSLVCDLGGKELCHLASIHRRGGWRSRDHGRRGVSC